MLTRLDLSIFYTVTLLVHRHTPSAALSLIVLHTLTCVEQQEAAVRPVLYMQIAWQHSLLSTAFHHDTLARACEHRPLVMSATPRAHTWHEDTSLARDRAALARPGMGVGRGGAEGRIAAARAFSQARDESRGCVSHSRGRSPYPTTHR